MIGVLRTLEQHALTSEARGGGGGPARKPQTALAAAINEPDWQEF